MKKLILLTIYICTIARIFGQSYSLTVESEYGFKFYGDYSGVVYAPVYTIGPYSSPFTVTLAPVSNYRRVNCDSMLCWNGIALNEYSLWSWTVDAVTDYTPARQVTVDAQQPACNAVANWSFYVHGDGCMDAFSAWLCNPVHTVMEGETFSCDVIIRNMLFIMQYEINLKYNPANIQLNAISWRTGDDNLTIDSSTPGIIRFACPEPEDFSVSIPALTWEGRQAGDDVLAFEIINNTGNPVTPDDNPPLAYPVSVIVRRDFRRFGDINVDGVVNIIDALMTAQHTVGLNAANFDLHVVDVNLDGSCNIVDALIIARYYVGLVDALPL